MLIIPAIDLQDGRCVRLTQGRRSDIKIYDADPLELACSFQAAGAQWLHVVDLDGAFNGGESPNRLVVRRIIEATNISVQFGGGVRSSSDVQQLTDAGASRVIVGTLAVERPDLLAQLVNFFGSRICVAIDARQGQVKVRGWEQETSISALALARRVADAGVERIIYTDISRDGMLIGPNIEETCEIASSSRVKVSASGGVASLADIQRLINANEPLIDSVIVGKALYEGAFSLAEALAISRNP